MGYIDHHMLVTKVISDVELKVIHYTLEKETYTARVIEEEVKVSLLTEKVEVLEYPKESFYSVFPPEKAVERARGRLGETQYGVVTNNCESFVNWALTGEAFSVQSARGVLYGAVAGARAVTGAYESYQNGEDWSEVLRGAFSNVVDTIKEFVDKKE